MYTFFYGILTNDICMAEDCNPSAMWFGVECFFMNMESNALKCMWAAADIHITAMEGIG